MNPIRFFHWQVWRYIICHPALTLLNLFSVAIGVAVFWAIELAIIAIRSFCVETAGVTAATPLIRGFVTLPDFPGEYLDVISQAAVTRLALILFSLGAFHML